MKLGSEEHKELFCRSFLDSHLDYEPEKMPWPDLDPVSLEKIRGIPFWKQALWTEKNAGKMVSAFAETVEDPLLREAIALQGREETRHGRLIAHLVNYYGIEVEIPELPEIPEQLEATFTEFGYEECLDSFFAFGMFGIARKAEYLPESLFTIFDPLLNEEARHIVFFVNWITYLQIRRGRGIPIARAAHSLYHYSKALWKLGSVFTDTEQKDEKAFAATGANTFMADLTPALFFTTCLAENEKRMGQFDRRLLRPELMPFLSRTAYRLLQLLPRETSLPQAG
ncbi:ferritin-like domain-containing protein [Pannus brasiliensis CCIBt3594]|uniref:Ferritin-like domain-containing protein n=1 Tax=Pannus brasiliensis CCIBt3594 TaxID=1427578 RepID=A0AAW9QF27_9CHRO